MQETFSYEGCGSKTHKTIQLIVYLKQSVWHDVARPVMFHYNAKLM